jgi:hypothetical protein
MPFKSGPDNPGFKKGQSGNPSGRPPGSRNKSTLAAEALLDGEAETLTRKAIEEAKAGNMIALRLCLERIVPPRKDHHNQFQMFCVRWFSTMKGGRLRTNNPHHAALFNRTASSGEFTARPFDY